MTTYSQSSSGWWLFVGLAGMVLTGLPQLMQNWSRQYYSEFFWQKMSFLAAALIFTFTVRLYVTRAENTISPIWGKLTALVSIFLWTNVAIRFGSPASKRVM